MAGLRREEAGISDVLAIAFMFIVVVFAGTILHGFALTPLATATDRQLTLRAEHAYHALELAHVDGYALTYFQAIAENLVLAQPRVPGDYLRGRLDNVLAHLTQPGFGIRINLSSGGKSWSQVYPTGARPRPAEASFRGKFSVVRAEAVRERVVEVNVELAIFKL